MNGTNNTNIGMIDMNIVNKLGNIDITKKMNDMDNARKRIDKAIEIKMNIRSLEFDENTCESLKEFYKILNEWVRTGMYANGKIKLPEIQKKIVYTLSNPKHTVVKLTML